MEERYGRCVVNEHQGEWFRTSIGLPQGAVISPLLFNIFVKDLFEEVKSDKCKFADDSTMWKRGKNIQDIKSDIQLDLNKISEWSRKWRININADKTEYCIFSRAKQHPGQLTLNLNNTNLKYNATPKILGVTLDEKLSYHRHIENLERKTGKSLGLLREIRGIGEIKTKFLIQIYNSMIGSLLNYASCVWQTASDDHLKKLNTVQRKGLSIVLGLPSTASLEAMEVIAGVLPLDLRREEIAIRDIGKVYSYSDKFPIKRNLDKWNKKETPDEHVTPLGKMNIQAENMRKNTQIEIKNIEPEFEFHGLSATKSQPEYWRNLGSSKTRTTEQERYGKEIITQLLGGTNEHTLIAFTDGSCQPNPGPCGAGALISLKEDTVELKQPVCKRGSILLAELIAIQLVIDYVIQSRKKDEIQKIEIFSDSQSAIGAIQLNWTVENHKQLVFSLKTKIKQLRNKGIETEIHWTPGHAEVAGNEEADRLAKEAAKEAAEITSDAHITYTKQDIRKAAKEHVNLIWQQRWDTSERGRFLYRFQPQVDCKTVKDFPSRKKYIVINNLRSGFAKLNDYCHKLNITDNPLCACGQSRETVEHYMLECELYQEARERLVHDIFLLSGIHRLQLETLLSVGKQDQDEMTSLTETEKLRLLGTFIEETN